jgi:hypothetical protein
MKKILRSGMNNGLAFASIFISSFALVMSLVAIILVVAQRMSTHRIEFKPLITNDLREEDKFQEDEEEDKTLQEAMRLSSEGKKKKKIEDPLDSILESSNF